MPGANYILSKGYLMTGSAAVVRGTAAKVATGSTLQPAQAALATAADGDLIGVFQEDLDAAKVQTGKAYVGVALMGIVECVASAAVVVGAYVTATTGGKMVTTTSAGDEVVGKAMTAAAADGDYFQVLLMIGSKVGA
jgi:hypothetical protein